MLRRCELADALYMSVVPFRCSRLFYTHNCERDTCVIHTIYFAVLHVPFRATARQSTSSSPSISPQLCTHYSVPVKRPSHQYESERVVLLLYFLITYAWSAAWLFYYQFCILNYYQYLVIRYRLFVFVIIFIDCAYSLYNNYFMSIPCLNRFCTVHYYHNTTIARTYSGRVVAKTKI
jgi:hypothetical protein